MNLNLILAMVLVPVCKTISCNSLVKDYQFVEGLGYSGTLLQRGQI